MQIDPKQNNPVGLILIIVTLIGLFAAIFMGQLVARNDYLKLGAIAGVAVAGVVCLGMGKNVWLLIPICWELTGNISVLPLPFSVRELGVLAAFGTYIALIAMKKFQGESKMDILSVFVAINLAYLCTMFLRNPVGTSAVGSDMVGGRPYFASIIGLLAFLLLARIRITPKLAYIFPILLLGPALIVTFMGTVTQVFPSLVPYIAPLYSGINVGEYVAQEFRGEEAGGFDLATGRFQTWGALGIGIMSALVSYASPAAVMNPINFFRFCALGLSAFAVLMSGFRNSFGEFGFKFLTAAIIWGRGMGFFKVVVVGLAAVATAIAFQALISLPNSIQRALSFLPGSWDPDIVQGAGESTDWRVDMWKIALTSDKYIKNKILGDGFGFSINDLLIMRSGGLGGQGFMSMDAQKEAFMIQGSFHSGPVSAIRFGGAVGLILIVAAQIVSMLYAWKLLKPAKGTPYFPLAVLLTLAATYRPFGYVFIFGDYRDDLPQMLFIAGMLKLLKGSLDTYRTQSTSEAPSELEGARVSPPRLSVPVAARVSPR